MRIVLTVIFVLVSIALSVIVLAQQGADAGLGAIGGIGDSYWSKNKSRSMEGKLAAGYKNSCRCICCTGSGTEFEFLGDGGSMQHRAPVLFLSCIDSDKNEGEKDWILIIRQKKKNSWSAVKR